MNFSRLYMQSWWEVPSIAYFCSLFRTAFNLLDFDIEELEEALVTDGTEDTSSSLLTELIVRLLNGCLGNNDISAFNYQMYLRRLFRRKCQETGRYNPFNTDIDFQSLPLRTKVEILYALCDFRLDAKDVFDLFKNLEAESLRVEPLGWDDNDSAYWYFYGTRLYREDIIRKPKGKIKKKRSKDSRRRSWFYGNDVFGDEESERVWQVVCFTEEDWTHLTEKFSKATSKIEKELYRSLSQNFLPEIPRLFQEKERLQRKRLLELPRRSSNRVLQKIKQKEEETRHNVHEVKEEEETAGIARENRAKRRNLLRSKSISSLSSKSAKEEMPQKLSKRSRSQDKKSKNSSSTHKGEPPPEQPVKVGRKTNNSLASATGQILIPDTDEPVNSTRKKLKTSQIFSQSDEDVRTDMYKVLEQLTAHDDAWPFMDPVEEEYAPNYYAVIRRPMDLHKMEKRLDNGYYTDFSMFKDDFKLIVNNCRLYNGQDNEYTAMVDNLQAAFDRLTEKYIHRVSSSDEEIAVEFQIPTPSRKHKLKSSESPNHHKKKRRKTNSDTGETKSSLPEVVQDKRKEKIDKEVKKSKESHKNKEGKSKKKRKSHHRHGKHSKNHKKSSHKSSHGDISKSKRSKKQKHSKNKDRSGKKSKKKKSKRREMESTETIKRSISQESVESSNRSRSASPLPSIHTPTPSPSELVEQTDNFDQPVPPDQLTEPEFFKDKYDKIKERRRHAAKDAWESLFDYKQKNIDKQKPNLTYPEKDKNKNLTETIEKLKAKNEKFKDSSLFNNLFTTNNTNSEKSSDINTIIKEPLNKDESTDIEGNQKTKSKKNQKKNAAKNESASEALEQAVKDISKWLDDTPKGTSASSPCASPAQTISTEEHDNSRLDDELTHSEKLVHSRKESTRKRRSSRDPKFLKRREIQRTIDRLQPGKGKGNLITNIANKVEKSEEIVSVGPLKVRESNKAEESSPKLTLGSVLPTVQFAMGSDHNFGNEKETTIESCISETQSSDEKKVKSDEQIGTEKEIEKDIVQTNKKDAEIETEPTMMIKPSQEKATPNLSAWFKAFGAPKNTPPIATVRRKVEDTDTDEKTETTTTTETKYTSPKNTIKCDSAFGPGTPNRDGEESPLANTTVTTRQRRTSTGSSISERSSFSQDLDSPRHQFSHTSPLIQSPASPRTEDFQKITYPIINGTVRAGFYQDTNSIKSSPEKSCSPREAPQSPYSQYAQHVYASNGTAGSSTPQYFIDQSKSPLPTYTQNPPPYYDTTKAAIATKPPRAHDDYTALGPESYQRNKYTGTFSPGYTPQIPTSNYSPVQRPPKTLVASTSSSVTNTSVATETKPTLFPVKKRTYNEPGHISPIPTKLNNTEFEEQNKNDYQKSSQPVHTMSSLNSNNVNDINSLNEKTDLTKIDNTREILPSEFAERKIKNSTKEPVAYENKEVVHELIKESAINYNKTNFLQKDNIDMVNMGYMNPDDRKINGEMHSDLSQVRDVSKHHGQPKGYDIEAIAINLGINNQAYSKTTTKPLPISSSNIPPAHMQDRSHSDLGLNQIMAHSHHNQYDTLSSGQTISNFSINDIEQANKKLYACNVAPSSLPIDYGNSKMSNQMRKQDMPPSDYSTSYSANLSEKTKSDSNIANNTAINYNKNSQQQYNAYVPRNNTHRTQDLQQTLPELRIPNPRGIIKACDQMNLSTSLGNTDNISKNDTIAKSQKQEKLIQNHPLVTSNLYKTPYSNHSSIPLDSLRNMPNIPQMLERYTNEERYSLAFAGSGSSIYHDKQYQMAQMFNKSMPPEAHSPTRSFSIPYSQPSISLSKESSQYKSTSSVVQSDAKVRNKKKRLECRPSVASSQTYHSPSCSTDVLSSVKSSIMPASAFNFGTSTNMALSSGFYGDNAGFSLDANQLMAANYMVAAVAHQQRNNTEVSTDKIAKPAHQNSNPTTGTFPFIGHSQVRAGYSFVGTETASPLYQQYLQRHQEELLRHTGAQIMSLYPSGYPPSLGVRQPYDSINRPSWH